MAVQMCFFRDVDTRFFFNILVLFPSSFFSINVISVYVVHPYSRIDTTVARKKMCFILSEKSYFYMIGNLSVADHEFASRIFISLLVDKMWLPWYVNLFHSFRETPFRTEMSRFQSKHMYSVLFTLTWRIFSRHSAWVGVFARSAILSA